MNSELARQLPSPSHDNHDAQAEKKSVLFVCLGNICRSPSAQGIFEYLLKHRKLSDKYVVDSAGTHEYHVGKAPDERAIESASKAGIEIGNLRGRQFCEADFYNYDHIFVMDQRNYEYLRRQYPTQNLSKVKPIISVLGDTELQGVPDPYHGKQKDFDEMMVMLVTVCMALLEELEEASGREAS